MFNKKIALILSSLLVTLILTLSITSCSTEAEPTTTAPSTPFEQLKADVTAVKTKVSGLEVAISNISTPTAQLNAINSDITAIEISMAVLQTKIDQLPGATDLTAINADIADIRIDVTSLANELIALTAQLDALVADIADIDIDTSAFATIESITAEIATVNLYIDGLVAGLQEQIDGLQEQIEDIITNSGTNYDEDIEGLTERIEDIEDNITTIADYWYPRVDDIYDEVISINAKIAFLLETPRVDISDFKANLGYLEFTTKTAGNYVVIITLYGSGLDTTLTTDIVPVIDMLPLFDECYGGDTMRVIILQPKKIGSPTPVSPNWTTNQVVAIGWGAANVNNATITTGVR